MGFSNKHPLILLILTLTLTSCYYDNEEDLYPSRFECEFNSTLSYQNEIRPIIATNCDKCHSNVTAPTLGNNIVLDTPYLLFSKGTEVINVINHNNGFSPMPKNGNKLGKCDIIAIETWINQGGNDN